MNDPNPVILLHGLRHNTFSMRKMANVIESQGWPIVNLGYPSYRHAIETLSERVWFQITTRYPDPNIRFNFVTHSMGGIILRQIAVRHADSIHRVVMLAPPNHGSELVNRFKSWRFARWLMGPGGQQLGVDEQSLPNRLGPIACSTGIIAGSKPDNPLARWFIQGPEDGRVSVESTRLEGSVDHLVVPFGHFFIMNYRPVIHQTIHFLTHGKFHHERTETANLP